MEKERVVKIANITKHDIPSQVKFLKLHWDNFKKANKEITFL